KEDRGFPIFSLTQGVDGAFYGATGTLGYDTWLVDRPETMFRLFPPETPEMLGVTIASSAHIVSFTGVGGKQYRVLRSADLHNWDQLDTITMPTAGVYTCVDSKPYSSRAYYRAAWVP